MQDKVLEVAKAPLSDIVARAAKSLHPHLCTCSLKQKTRRPEWKDQEQRDHLVRPPDPPRPGPACTLQLAVLAAPQR
eukprot:3705697-Rhodomonas_salina.2